MYFCYVDESGDSGAYDANNPQRTGSAFFILTGVIVHSSKWRPSLETLKTFRKRIAQEGYLPYNIEFHCSEMIDPHKTKAFTSISIAARWELMERFAQIIGQNTAFTVLAVVIDKHKSGIQPQEYFTSAITKLYQAFDEFLNTNSGNGILFFDRANERHIHAHVRRLLGTGAGGEPIPNIRITWIIEDPIFRLSHESMFIQAADVAAYLLKEREFSQVSRRKYLAHKIFTNRLQNSCFKSRIADQDGTIRL